MNDEEGVLGEESDEALADSACRTQNADFDFSCVCHAVEDDEQRSSREGEEEDDSGCERREGEDSESALKLQAPLYFRVLTSTYSVIPGRRSISLHATDLQLTRQRRLLISTTMSTAATPEAAAQLLFPPNVQYNNSRLYTVKFLSSCFAGAVAGVLGLENTLGFALFVFSTLLTSSCLYLKCKGRPGKFVPGGWWELVNPGQENTFSFVLVWTLFYGTPITLVYAFWCSGCQRTTNLLDGAVHRNRTR